MSDKKLGILFAFITTSLWAVQGILLKYSLQSMSTYTVVFGRFFIATILLIAWMLYKDRSSLEYLRKAPLALIVSGVLLGVNSISFMIGIDYTGPANAQVLIQMGPLILVLLGIFYFKEELRRRQIVGVLIVTTGQLLFYYDQIEQVLGGAQKFQLGNLWLILSAICWALSTAITKKFTRTHSGPQINVLLYAFSAIITMPFVPFTQFSSLTSLSWLLLFGFGLLSVVAYGALAEALKRIPSYQVSLIIILNPMMTIGLLQIMSTLKITLINIEHLHWEGYVGAILVLLGMAVATSAVFTKSKE